MKINTELELIHPMDFARGANADWFVSEFENTIYKVSHETKFISKISNLPSLKYPNSISVMGSNLLVSSTWSQGLGLWDQESFQLAKWWHVSELGGLCPTKISYFENHLWILAETGVLANFCMKNQQWVLLEKAQLNSRIPHDFFIDESTVMLIDKQGLKVFEDQIERQSTPLANPQFCRILGVGAEGIWLHDCFENTLLSIRQGEIQKFPFQRAFGFYVGQAGCLLASSFEEVREFKKPNIEPNDQVDFNFENDWILPFKKLDDLLTRTGKAWFESQSSKNRKITFNEKDFFEKRINEHQAKLREFIQNKSADYKAFAKLALEWRLQTQKYAPAQKTPTNLREDYEFYLPMWSKAISYQKFPREGFGKGLKALQESEICKFVFEMDAPHQVKDPLNFTDNYLTGIQIAIMLGKPQLVEDLIIAIQRKEHKRPYDIHLLAAFYMGIGKNQLAIEQLKPNWGRDFEIRAQTCQFLATGKKPTKSFGDLKDLPDYNFLMGWHHFQCSHYERAISFFKAHQKEIGADFASSLYLFICYLLSDQKTLARSIVVNMDASLDFKNLMIAGLQILEGKLNEAVKTISGLGFTDHRYFLEGIVQRLRGEFEIAEKMFLEEEERFPKWTNILQIAIVKIQAGERPWETINSLPEYAWIPNQGKKVYKNNHSFRSALETFSESESSFQRNIHQDLVKNWFHWLLLKPFPFYVFW